MTTEQDQITALEQKSWDFSRWIFGGKTVSHELIKRPCPKCGYRVVCGYADMGVVDYYDTYAHVCLNPDCDYGVTEQFFFHSNWGPDGPRPTCPFCEANQKVNR